MACRPSHVAFACISALAPTVTVAAEFTWNSGNSGSYSDPAKWSPAGGPPRAADTANFSDAALPRYAVTVPGGTQTGAVNVAGDAVDFVTSIPTGNWLYQRASTSPAELKTPAR